MNTMKKLLLSLSVAVVMCIAFVIGIVGNSSPKALVSGGGTI